MGKWNEFKEFIKPLWSDEDFKQRSLKAMPSMYYEQTRGIHNYSLDQGFSIIEPERYRSLIYGGYAPSNFIELFHCIPEIFAPIHEIASRIANADFQLRKTFNDEIVYKNKEWNKLFETPNPLQHFRELIYEAVVYEYVTGDEFMYFNNPATLSNRFENIVAIWNLPADSVTPVLYDKIKLFSATDIKDIVKSYRLDDNTEFLPENILHIRSINLSWKDRKLKGKTQLLSADKAIQNLIAVYEARNVIYTKRGALGFIVSRKTDADGTMSLTDSEKTQILNQHHSRHGLGQGQFPVGVADAPIDYIKIGATISELEPFKETLADACAIYGVLGVPDNLIPGADKKSYENFAQADRALFQNVVIPKANMYMQSISNKLGLTEAKLYLHASFDNVESLQENKTEKASWKSKNFDTGLKMFQAGVIKLNELVVESGYEKKDNPLYDKVLYDMDEQELERVKEIMNIQKPVNNGTATENTGDAEQQGGNLKAV